MFVRKQPMIDLKQPIFSQKAAGVPLEPKRPMLNIFILNFLGESGRFILSMKAANNTLTLFPNPIP